MDIIGNSKRAFTMAASVALGAASSDKAARVMAMSTLNRGFMRHMLRPGLYGMGGGAALGMGGSLAGGMMNGDMPTFGQVLGSGIRGGFMGGIGGMAFGGGRGLHRSQGHGNFRMLDAMMSSRNSRFRRMSNWANPTMF